MDRNSKSAFFLSLSDSRVILVALAVVGVIFVQSPPLENTRLPVSEPQHFSAREIDARSWQDPFAAIEKHRANARKNGSAAGKDEQAPATASSVLKLIRAQQAEVLAVMLPGGPYSEDGETRRRVRYAVVAGLNAKHLVSAESEKLSYFIADKAGDDAHAAPVLVPFESYLPANQPHQETRRQADKDKDKKEHLVLVLWLRAEDFSGQPIQRLLALRKQLGGTDATWRIIGPPSSAELKSMIDEVASPKPQPLPNRKTHLRFYSPFATVPDIHLLKDVPAEGRPQTVHDFFATKGISFVRTIGNDQWLASVLVEELKRRGVMAKADPLQPKRVSEDACSAGAASNPPATRVMVLAERDTLYARNMLRAFAERGRNEGLCVDSVDYLRGLDGELPPDGDSQPRTQEAGKPATPDNSAKASAGTAPAEVAAGQQQFDYLRRIAVRLREHDQALRRDSHDARGGLRAIGVLGSDVHDKLLVLQALKQEFPNLVFFTTDIDARFLHPREQAWTRNLLVASSLGLRLNDKVQGGTPPFRSGYQSAVYLSTLLAIAEAQRGASEEPPTVSQDYLDRWFGVGRLFEIGRTTAFDFGGEPADGIGTACAYDLFHCDSIHPPGSPAFPMPSFALRFLIFAVVVGCLCAAVWAAIGSERRRALLAQSKEVSPSRRRVATVVAVYIAVQLGLPIWLAFIWPSLAVWLTTDGTPMVGFEGISHWPSEAVRMLVIFLCGYLVLHGRVKLADNVRDIGDRFKLAADPKPDGPSWKHLWPARAQWSTDGKPVFDAFTYWTHFVHHNSLLAQLVRMAALASIVFPLGWILFKAFDGGAMEPLRSALSRNVHGALQTAALIMMGLVLVFVVETVACCALFAYRLHDITQSWQPPAPVDRLGPFPMPAPLHRSWLELQLILHRTKAVAGVVYYPFIVPSLLMLSSSGFFGVARVPLGPVVVALAGAAVAVACAWTLHHFAEDCRNRVLEEIDDRLMDAKADKKPNSIGNAPTQAQLEQLRTDVVELKDGAFAPFWEQTMFKAMLIPFAAIGSTSLIVGWLSRVIPGI